MEARKIDPPLIDPNRGALIAIVGVDGSGKSTLVTKLARSIGRVRPTEICYLGLGSADMRERIASFGPPGRWLAAGMVKRAEQLKDKSKKISGAATAIGSYWLTRQRLKRFHQAHALKNDGLIVITDRYPQNEIMGFYDGPILSAARAEGLIVKRLARAERQLYHEMAAIRPELVIKLVINVDAALARSPDHMRHDIQRKAAAGAMLTFNNAPCVEVDASHPLEQVFGAIEALVFERMGISALGI